MKQIILILLFSVTVISAQWSTDPASPQSLGSGIQAQLAATSDGGVSPSSEYLHRQYAGPIGLVLYAIFMVGELLHAWCLS